MNGWYNPDNLLDLVDHVVLALAGIAAVAIPSYFAARNHKGIQEVRAQVVNSHPDRNLRDDLDRAIAAIEDLAHDVRSIKTDLAEEERKRRDHVAELRDEVNRKHTELTRRLGA